MPLRDSEEEVFESPSALIAAYANIKAASVSTSGSSLNTTPTPFPKANTEEFATPAPPSDAEVAQWLYEAELEGEEDLMEHESESYDEADAETETEAEDYAETDGDGEDVGFVVVQEELKKVVVEKGSHMVFASPEIKMGNGEWY
jgi:hypothetical protein